MSWFLAAVYDPFMRRSEEACLRAWRKELLSDLAGEVLELGAGTGANLPFYPPAVRRIVATEPDAAMSKRLARKVDDARVEVVHARAESLPFAGGSFDAVVSTLVLCSVDDLDRSLQEARRVLRDDGTLLFLEHVASARPSRARLQRMVEPLWKPIADGCHLTRRTDEAIARAGFVIEKVQRESMRKALPWVRETIRGAARAA